MEKEIKIVKYVLLTYVMFGLMNVFILKDFVVPLPIIYIAIPMVAIYFFILSIRSALSWFFIIIPLIVLKDIMMDYNINFVAIISLISLITWVVFGIVILLKTQHKSNFITFYSVFLMISVLTLLPIAFNLSWIIFPLIGLFGSLFLKSNLDFLSSSELSLKNQHSDLTRESFDVSKNEEHSINNWNQLVMRRISLLIILICGFYTITLISIWSMML